MTKSSDDIRGKAFKFLQTNRTATLATVDESGVPHAAAVDFVAHKDLCLYFTTRVEARKFKNLIFQPVVAMAVTDEENMITVQLTGKAERVEDLNTEQSLMAELWRLRFNGSHWPLPAVQLFERGASSQLAVIKVTPTEMTLASFETTESGKYRTFFEKII